MVKHQIFGVERDIDIPADVFPTEDELQEFEDLFPGVNTEHGWFDSCYGGIALSEVVAETKALHAWHSNQCRKGMYARGERA
jgi:hypothetical protein